jgi:iron complex transport system substrate-binding protein
VSHRVLLALLAVLVVLALAACGGSGEDAAPADTGVAPAEAPSEFPVTVTGANGELTLPERPTRVVSLSPTATESLFALGAGDQVVAVDDQSNYPSEAPKTKLSGFEPNIEAIAGYEPDLVVAGFDPGGLVRGLEKLDVPVLLQPAAANLEEGYEQIEVLATATGRTSEGDALVERMQSRIDELIASVPAGTGDLSVYHEISPDYYSATSETFIGSVYERLGLTNIADEAGAEAPDYPQLSAEYILSSDPDLIVLSDAKCCGQTPETVAARPGWRTLEAVTEGDVIPVDDDIASRWGPRTVDFVEIVVQAIAEAAGS